MTIEIEHSEGMPCWIDASVSSKEEREGLTEFYSALFGWSFDVGSPETGFYSIARQSGRAVVGIGEQEQGKGDWVTYFATDDIEQACKRAASHGGQIFFPPMQVMDVGSMALVLDPTGAVHGFWQANTFSGVEIMYEPNTPGWFDHASDNPAKASQYYQSVLSNGIEADEQDGMTILRRGDQWFASFTHEDPSTSNQSPRWTPVFVVDSLERIRARVRELSGNVLVEEISVPGSAISILQDPILGKSITVMRAGENSSSGN